jgi:3-phosphoshikimate 1-carboxyvinyltransferase
MCAVLIATILKTEIELDDISCIKKSFPEFLEYIEKYYA